MVMVAMAVVVLVLVGEPDLNRENRGDDACMPFGMALGSNVG